MSLAEQQRQVQALQVVDATFAALTLLEPGKFAGFTVCRTSRTAFAHVKHI